MSRIARPTSSLWEYALETYQRPLVSQACLALQDRLAADVNLLLTAGWLADQGILWGKEDILALMALCNDWRESCLLPLRAVRRYLRGRLDVGNDAVAVLYEQGKAMELEAERYQLSLIENAVHASILKSAVCLPNLLAVNVENYLALLSGDPSRYRSERDTLVGVLSSTT